MFPVIASTVVLLVCWSLITIWIWTLHRQWWSARAVRRALWIAPLVGLSVIGLWALFVELELWSLVSVASFIVTMIDVIVIALAVSLPISGVALTIERIVRWSLRRARRSRADSTPAPAPTAAEPLDEGRRSFITKAAILIPGTTVAAGLYGVADSYSAVTSPLVPLRFAGLHPDLQGLRILHLSDIHLGYFIKLDDLEEALVALESQKPDIVLVSGDISDDLPVLGDALRMMTGLKPRYGTFASLGNHEYYRGIEQVHRTFDAGPLPLLVSEGTTVKIGGTSLHLSGADDPARARGDDNHGFLRSSIDTALNGAPSDAFHLLMSHRPEGFDLAAERGVHLTVSGHYHGGIQFGFNGRAVIQPFAPSKYFWGHYQKGASQLYTSAGVGHWFPFRLNCPPEAPLYVLERA